MADVAQKVDRLVDTAGRILGEVSKIPQIEADVIDIKVDIVDIKVQVARIPVLERNVATVATGVATLTVEAKEFRHETGQRFAFLTSEIANIIQNQQEIITLLKVKL